MRFPIYSVYTCPSKSINEQRKWIYRPFSHGKKMICRKKPINVYELNDGLLNGCDCLFFGIHCALRKLPNNNITLWKWEWIMFLCMPMYERACVCVLLSWHERIKLNDNVSIVVYAKCNVILKNSKQKQPNGWLCVSVWMNAFHSLGNGIFSSKFHHIITHNKWNTTLCML